MSHWVLSCPGCQQEFAHSKIKRETLTDYFFDRKPEFPREGLLIECPHCNTKSVYQRTQLRFRHDAAATDE